MHVRDLGGAAAVALLAGTAGFFGGYVSQNTQPTQNVDATVPAQIVETLAQARCGLWVFEDGSADFEADDAVRSECYRRLTGTPLFAHPRHR